MIASGFNFVEGPVWIEGLGLLFSDIPENKVYLLNANSKVSEYINPSGKSNGLALNNEGELILCQHLDRQIGIYKNGSIETLASHYNGKQLNSPNDLTIKSNGTIYFTDPDFGLNDEGLTSELGYKGIYCVTSDGKLHLLDKSLNLPNGICFSPDESKIYIVDSQIADIYVWDVVDDTTITNKTLFYNNPGMWGDGMKIDQNGFLYATANNGLSILSSEGKLIDRVAFNGNGPSNCNWGILNDQPVMFITAGSTLWSVKNKEVQSGINDKLQHQKFQLYPNPANEFIKIKTTDRNKNNRIEISDINGQIIREVINIQADQHIDIRNLSKGNYTATFYIEGKSITRIFVKE